MKAVFGNNDADIFKHLHKPGNIIFYDRFYIDEHFGRRIALLHGDPEELAIALFESRRYDLLLRGHNHVAEIRKNEKTLMINPGSLIGPIAGHNEWTGPSVAIYESDKNARIIKLSDVTA